MADNGARRFGRHTIAHEVVAGVDLTGKVVVITGGSGGIGKETARVLAQAGAHVVIGGRDTQALLTAKRDIAAVVPDAHISVHPLDLISLESVHDFARAVGSLGRALDILICNAGIMGMPLSYAPCGIELQLMTNYVGHVVLASVLAPMLRRAGQARVVVLTSSGHQLSSVLMNDLNFRARPYDKWEAYGQSKTACALLAVHLGQRMKLAGVTAMAVHPGTVHTELGRYLSGTEREEIRRLFDGEHKSLEAGAATSVWAATAPELEGCPVAYLEDCHIAAAIDKPNGRFGVMPYALDAGLAEQLWRSVEGMLQQVLTL